MINHLWKLVVHEVTPSPYWKGWVNGLFAEHMTVQGGLILLNLISHFSKIQEPFN
jgi:hypothetical protein